jgi:hypothetical protein
MGYAEKSELAPEIREPFDWVGVETLFGIQWKQRYLSWLTLLSRTIIGIRRGSFPGNDDQLDRMSFH